MRAKTNQGFTLLEMIISVAMATIVLVAAVMSVDREARSLGDLSRESTLEQRADEVLARIGEELEFALGAEPVAWLAADLGAHAEGIMLVDRTDGFPASGVLLLQPGTEHEERIAYEELSIKPTGFVTLIRAAGCTKPRPHPKGTLVRWCGSASVLEDQDNPPKAFYDGISGELIGNMHYRGDGAGFSFRVPVDPSGGMDFFDAAGDVQWGAILRGRARTTGWSCLTFVPHGHFREAARGFDLNQDGDTEDVFDLGRIALRSWDVANPDIEPVRFALCPPIVVQERCEFGSDLDADGFADPIFLWDPATARLRVRLFLLTAGELDETPTLRRLERNLYLRNSVSG